MISGVMQHNCKHTHTGILSTKLQDILYILSSMNLLYYTGSGREEFCKYLVPALVE